MAYVYILKSLRNQHLYIGSTNYLARRLLEHKSGKSKYTKGILPIELVFKQKFEDLVKARRAEHWLKKQKSRNLLNKIITEGEIKKDFS